MVFQWIKNSYQALQTALSSTRKELGIRFKKLFGRYVDEELLEEIEEILYESDLGVSIIQDLIAKIRLHMKSHPQAKAEDILHVVETGLIDEMKHFQHHLTFAPEGTPTIFLFVGTNGNGKTTSCAKMAHHLTKNLHKTVLFGACDTFRAAAQEQLSIWADRLGIDIVKGRDKGDPAAVAFDAISKAKARNIDVVLLDTAGRLENKTHLLQELDKIRRSCKKAYDSIDTESNLPHETLLVMDATTGQNGLEQAKAFHSVTPLTGIILTKLDGSAKGGTAISIQKQLGLPVKYIGVGEGIEDLIPFDPELFVKAMIYDDEKNSLLRTNLT